MIKRKEIETAAHKYAVHRSEAPDKQTPDWIMRDFQSGAEWALSQFRKPASIFYILQAADDAGENRHPELVVKDLGMIVQWFEPIGFAGGVKMIVHCIPDQLPNFIKILPYE